jgi:hypothetical protein
VVSQMRWRKWSLRAAFRVYGSLIVSSLLTALLLSSAFVYGAVSMLGPGVNPLLHKNDLIAEIVFSLVLPLAVILGIFRNAVLTTVNYFKEAPVGLHLYFWIMITALFPILVFVGLTNLPAVLIYNAPFFLIPALVAIGSFAVYYFRGYRTFWFLCLCLLLISASNAGKAWVDSVRNSEPTSSIEVSSGAFIDAKILLSTSTGLVIFEGMDVTPSMIPWDKVRAVRSSESVREIVEFEAQSNRTLFRWGVGYICSKQNDLLSLLFDKRLDRCLGIAATKKK